MNILPKNSLLIIIFTFFTDDVKVFPKIFKLVYNSCTKSGKILLGAFVKNGLKDAWQMCE